MKKVNGIAKEAIEFIIEVSKSSYPHEFAGLLQTDENNVISDIIIVPGTESGERSALFNLFMLPNISSVGSVHSHPSGVVMPSSADLQMFGRTGNYHIIIGYPYDLNSWKCFNSAGEERDLKVIDS